MEKTRRDIILKLTDWWWCSVAKSRPTLCDLMDCSPPGSSVHRISQARILEWVAIFFSRAPSWRIESSRRILYHWATREAQEIYFCFEGFAGPLVWNSLHSSVTCDCFLFIIQMSTQVPPLLSFSRYCLIVILVALSPLVSFFLSILTANVLIISPITTQWSLCLPIPFSHNVISRPLLEWSF